MEDHLDLRRTFMLKLRGALEYHLDIRTFMSKFPRNPKDQVVVSNKLLPYHMSLLTRIIRETRNPNFKE